MSDAKQKAKAILTPRQAEIKKLSDKGRDKRTDQESARLDQLRSEEKRDRFLRLAPRRVQKAIKAVRQIVNLANRASYSYTDDESSRIVTALENAVGSVCDAFSPRSKADDTFTL